MMLEEEWKGGGGRGGEGGGAALNGTKIRSRDDDGRPRD